MRNVPRRWVELPASQRLVAASDAAGPSRPVLVHHSPGEDAAACVLHAAKVADMREVRVRVRVCVLRYISVIITYIPFHCTLPDAGSKADRTHDGLRFPTHRFVLFWCGMQSVNFLSLGHNRSADVEGAILTAMREGHWLVLLHAHAEPHWLHGLFPLLSSTTLPPVSSGGSPGEVHADFQLWACVPTAEFGALPGALLTAGVVVALEPPRHIQVRARCLSFTSLLRFHTVVQCSGVCTQGGRAGLRWFGGSVGVLNTPGALAHA